MNKTSFTCLCFSITLFKSVPRRCSRHQRRCTAYRCFQCCHTSDFKLTSASTISSRPPRHLCHNFPSTATSESERMTKDDGQARADGKCSCHFSMGRSWGLKYPFCQRDLSRANPSHVQDGAETGDFAAAYPTDNIKRPESRRNHSCRAATP